MQHSSLFPEDAMCKVYFSCPKFTVLLVTKGSIITKAAPITKRFEGHSIGALTTWARGRFGGPITVKELKQSARFSANRGEGGPTAVHGVSDK
jgi:hypothetical protein